MTPIISTASSRRLASGVVLHDVIYASEGEPMAAYMLEPARANGCGLIYFHWYEPRAADSNREEFLDEASDMARRGFTSLLVQGTLPWDREPRHADDDRRAILAMVAALRTGVSLLGEAGCDATRIGAVGHDFGAMYLALLATMDRRPAAYVLMAATPRWADWFVPYWELSMNANDYRAAMTDLDPIEHVAGAAPAKLLFQFARRDQRYVPNDVAARFYAAASEPKEIRWYATGHRLNRLASKERRDWLERALRSTPE